MITKPNEIYKRAKELRDNVEKNYALTKGYPNNTLLFAKAILEPNKTLETKTGITVAPNPHGTAISRQIPKSAYINLAKNLILYVEKLGRLPNFLTYGGYQIKTEIYVYMFARIVAYYYEHNKTLPNYVNVNSRAFDKPQEPYEIVYEYFCTIFGKRVTTIDDALSLIDGNGYGYYYDDVYNNSESIRRMKNGNGVNCTDSCQVFYNLVKYMIKKYGKYKKVECLHIQCSGGDGHVRLRITLNDGTKIYRDPACVLNGGGITCNWCSNGSLIAVDPSWFLENVNR